MKNVTLTLSNRIKLYFVYIYYTLIIFGEIRKDRIKFFKVQVEIILQKLLRKRMDQIQYDFHFDLVLTTYGDFHIRPNTIDVEVCSPSYERIDRNILLKIAEKLMANNERVLFMDIGADFVLFTVLFAKYFANKKCKNFSVVTFEPLKENFNLLLKNIKVNHLEQFVLPENIAVGDNNSDEQKFFYSTKHPGWGSLSQTSYLEESTSVSLISLDSYFKKHHFDNFTTVILKIDTEGNEKNILLGAKELFASNKKVIICAEDNAIFSDYIKSSGLQFLHKGSVQNTWWKTK